MRSALDPLPRFLSIRSLAVLVTMLVAGIAISVHEYLESGRIVRRVHAADTLPEGTPMEFELEDSGSEAACLPADSALASPEGGSACDRSIEGEPSADAAPGLWIPDSSPTGS
ncbi:MAG: hypothetical protein ACKVXR_16710 [Planctomycetota bacterium]